MHANIFPYAYISILDIQATLVYNSTRGIKLRILADSQITNATITTSNGLSFAPPEKMQIFQLADKYKAASGIDQIVMDFNSSSSGVNCVALCGSNLSSNATATLSYSDTAPGSPEDTITLPTFSNFNQVWFLPASLDKRYWVIDINDPNPQGSSAFELGYLYIGEYTQINSVLFPHTPTLNIISQPATSGTGQEYGSKVMNQNSIEFSADFTTDTLADMLEILQSKQNIDPVLLVPFEDSLDNALYPPRYGVLSSDSYAYPMDGTPGLYSLTLSHRETF